MVAYMKNKTLPSIPMSDEEEISNEPIIDEIDALYH